MTGNWVAWLGLIVVASNIVSSLFNSHLFDFTHGWIYVFGVGVMGGMVLAPLQPGADAERSSDNPHAADFLVPISVGELMDKITILEIKSERIADRASSTTSRRELAALRAVRLRRSNARCWSELCTELKRVNATIVGGRRSNPRMRRAWRFWRRFRCACPHGLSAQRRARAPQAGGQSSVRARAWSKKSPIDRFGMSRTAAFKTARRRSLICDEQSAAAGSRILIIALRRLGDVLLTTPLVRTIRRGFPQAKLDLLVFRGSERILKGNPDIDDVLVDARAARRSRDARLGAAAVAPVRSGRFDPGRRPPDLFCLCRRASPGRPCPAPRSRPGRGGNITRIT